MDFLLKPRIDKKHFRPKEAQTGLKQARMYPKHKNNNAWTPQKQNWPAQFLLKQYFAGRREGNVVLR
jgi:hypothetical protein